MKKKYSVVMTAKINNELLSHLIRQDGDEDLCFCLYNPSNGAERFTGIIDEVILPLDGERQVHGNVSFNPEYYERVLSLAAKKGKGIAFLHSHPGSGFQLMSSDDVKAEKQMSKSVKSITGLPLLGMTTGNDGTWSARFWIKAKKKVYKREWCESVRVLGNNLKIHFNNSLFNSTIDKDALQRTISAWGIEKQKDISKIKIGIIGLGSVGSMVSECLARTGFSNFTLIDFDKVENRNRDRGMNLKKNHIGKLKIDVAANAIKVNGTATRKKIIKIPLSIYEESAYMAALDCDVIFSCVDRPHARQIINYISYTALIPVIDGGIKVSTNKNNTKFVGADWKVNTVGYDRPCLECLGQFNAHYASLDKEGFLDNEKYIEGAGADIKNLAMSENVFAFSMNVASLEVLQLLSLLILPEYLAKRTEQLYHFKLGSFDESNIMGCNENCFYNAMIGLGDNTGVTVYKTKSSEFSAEPTFNPNILYE